LKSKGLWDFKMKNKNALGAIIGAVLLAAGKNYQGSKALSIERYMQEKYGATDIIMNISVSYTASFGSNYEMYCDWHENLEETLDILNTIKNSTQEEISQFDISEYDDDDIEPEWDYDALSNWLMWPTEMLEHDYSFEALRESNVPIPELVSMTEPVVYSRRETERMALELLENSIRENPEDHRDYVNYLDGDAHCEENLRHYIWTWLDEVPTEWLQKVAENQIVELSFKIKINNKSVALTKRQLRHAIIRALVMAKKFKDYDCWEVDYSLLNFNVEITSTIPEHFPVKDSRNKIRGF
jgi:uncharacterized membrane protein